MSPVLTQSPMPICAPAQSSTIGFCRRKTAACSWAHAGEEAGQDQALGLLLVSITSRNNWTIDEFCSHTRS